MAGFRWGARRICAGCDRGPCGGLVGDGSQVLSAYEIAQWCGRRDRQCGNGGRRMVGRYNRAAGAPGGSSGSVGGCTPRASRGSFCTSLRVHCPGSALGLGVAFGVEPAGDDLTGEAALA